MRLEEALVAIREGKKVRHPSFESDVYLIGCYVGFSNESFEEKKKRGMSIALCKGDRQHDSMAGVSNYVAKIKRQLKQILTEEDYKKYHNIYTEIEIARIFDEDIFKFPQLNLFLLMSDEWEIIE